MREQQPIDNTTGRFKSAIIVNGVMMAALTGLKDPSMDRVANMGAAVTFSIANDREAFIESLVRLVRNDFNLSPSDRVDLRQPSNSTLDKIRGGEL